MRSDLRQIIADSSGIISLVNEMDSNHRAAERFADQLAAQSGIIIVPEDVFSETLNIVSKKLGRDKAITTGELLRSGEGFAVLAGDEAIQDAAFALFRQQHPSVSFTDCMVMAFATSYGTKDIFGFDDVFAKNGYVLPRSERQAA